MKNNTMPITISGKDESILKVVVICDAPWSRKVISAAVPIIISGLNFASQETIIAVKPCPPTLTLVTE